MRVLVAVPAVSERMALSSDCLRKHFLEVCTFTPTIRNLDAFHEEARDIRPPGLFGINIPHWNFEEKGGQGVSGPGLPKNGPLVCPPSLLGSLVDMLGVYDRWRPYPAKKMTEYAESMAWRCVKKRCKVFEKAARDMEWDRLYYVEHAPASIAHLDQKVASEIAEHIFMSAVSIMTSMPFLQVAIFSPYGPKEANGFVVSNHMEASELRNWEKIRGYLNENTRY